MTLNINKSISITGGSVINGQRIVYLSANVTTDTAGNTNINQSIENQAVYRQNKEECRKDIDAFQDEVWKVEDELLTESTEKNEM
ncbi:hypothetical protein IGI96_000896 [Enterococcus sp. DIV0421]|uniref:hypothetical protein n=1 Tax=Enterococcus sp. DIV0421 TaxID=2774688 RepID=UPI003F21CB20